MSEIAESTTLHRLTLLPEDSPARRPASRRKYNTVVSGWMAHALASGQNISALCGSYGPLGSLSKILLASKSGLVRLRLVWRGLATEFPEPNCRLRILVLLIKEGVCTLLPTPCASDATRWPGSEAHPRLLRPRGLHLQEELGMRPPVEVVEWMMGFSPGWTDLEHLEMPQCHR